MAPAAVCVLMESPGGIDKESDGHRRDTVPILDAIIACGVDAYSMSYTAESHDRVFNELIQARVDAVFSRIAPGTLKNEKMYFQMLRELHDRYGVLLMPHPDAMIGYGAKDALVKLNDTKIVPSDTRAYYSLSELKETFPKTIVQGERVLKQNKGTRGEGIWRVQLVTNVGGNSSEAGLNSLIRCTEAKDNHVESHRLGDFLDFCAQYLVGEGGQLVDMRYLPRIKEGEIRVVMIDTKPVQVVRKIPAATVDAFSATLFSGAKYMYLTPAEAPAVCTLVTECLPMIQRKLGGYDVPLIWTCDFILDTNADGSDAYILGEMNCTCVDISYDLPRLPALVGRAVADILKESLLDGQEENTTNKDTTLALAISDVLDPDSRQQSVEKGMGDLNLTGKVVHESRCCTVQ